MFIFIALFNFKYILFKIILPVRSIHSNENIIFIIYEMIGSGCFWVMNIGNSGVGVWVGVDELNNICSVIPLCNNPSNVIIVKFHRKSSRFKCRRHSTKWVVCISLFSSSCNKSPLIIAGKFFVSIHHYSIAAIIACCVIKENKNTSVILIIIGILLCTTI